MRIPIISELRELRSQQSILQKALLDLSASSKAGVSVTPDSAMRQATVWACIRVLSSSMGALPLHVYEDLSDGSKRRATEHPVYNLLHRAPNPEISAFTYRQQSMANLCMYGNFYTEIETDDRGFPVALWPIPARNCEPARNENKELVYLVNINGETRNLPAYRVLHFMGMGTDGIKGLSPIKQMMETIGISIAAEQFGGSFFGNGANVGLIVEHPKQLSGQGSENLRKSLAEKYSGLDKSHRIMLLEEGMKATKATIPPDEAQFLETRQFQVEDIARIFGVQLHKIGHLLHATFCLPADVEVYTEYGPKSISSITVGEKVWSLDGDNWQLKTVLRSGCTGNDDILEIKTTNRNIHTNAKHRILARRKYNAPRSGVGGYQCVEWRNEWIPAGELKVGDTIVSLGKLPISTNEIIPTRKATIPFMEFCGLYLGDGNKTSGYINIARSADANYMDYYRDVIVSEFENDSGTVHLNEQARSTRFSSVKASSELSKLGFDGTAHNKKVPAWVFNLTEELQLAFLRGFLDADGSVDKKGRISFSSCNESMLSQIRHLCIALGIPVTNQRCQEGFTTLPNGRRIALKQYCFTCSDPGNNRRIGSHDIRYIQRLNDGKPFSKKARNYPRYGGVGIKSNSCEIARIVSIDVIGNEPVYDLEVDGSHSFIANGVVVHNSNIEHQAIEFVTDTMLPWTVNYEMEYDRKLFPSTPQFYTKHSLEGLLRGDSAARAALYTALYYLSAICADEIREKEEMNPLPNGEGKRYYVQSNMVPIDKIDQYLAKNTGSQPSRNLTDTVKRIVDRNRENIIRQYKTNPEKFTEWLDSYSRDFPNYMIKELLEIDK